MPNIIEFYSGNEDVQAPYTLKEILSFDDRHLEVIHNHIQWLFPTNDPNNKLKGKPYLDDDEIRIFNGKNKLGEDLRFNLELSFNKMMFFYGFQLESDPMRLVKANDFDKKAKNWLNRSNHNYLRITRMLESLRLLGMEPYAQIFFDMLKKIYEDYYFEIGETTWTFWKKAANRETEEDKKAEDVFYTQLKKQLGVNP